MVKKLLLVFPLLMIAKTVVAERMGDKIVGLYYVVDEYSKEESRIRIYRINNGTYEGKVEWINKPYHKDGSLRLDVKNPIPELRHVPCSQLVILTNLCYNSETQTWENGVVYNPQDGKKYSAYMEFESDKKLRVRGYWGISMLGRTMYWDKIE